MSQIIGILSQTIESHCINETYFRFARTFIHYPWGRALRFNISYMSKLKSTAAAAAVARGAENCEMRRIVKHFTALYNSINWDEWEMV